MKIKTKDGKVLTVIDLDFETGRTLNGYVCDDGNTYPPDECEVVRPFKKAWEPKRGDTYWIPRNHGSVRNYQYDGSDFDQAVVKSGNTYRDKETAKAESEYISALRRIRNVIRENGQEVQHGQRGFAICIDESKHLVRSWADYHCLCGGIVVRDKEFADWLIENYRDDLKILAGIKEA